MLCRYGPPSGHVLVPCSFFLFSFPVLTAERNVDSPRRFHVAHCTQNSAHTVPLPSLCCLAFESFQALLPCALSQHCERSATDSELVVHACLPICMHNTLLEYVVFRHFFPAGSILSVHVGALYRLSSPFVLLCSILPMFHAIFLWRLCCWFAR